MTAAHRRRLFDAHIGQGEQRLRIARTVGLQALELIEQCAVRSTGRSQAGAGSRML